MWQLWTKVYLLSNDNNISLTYHNSTLATGWSTAGVADSNLTKVFLLQVLKVFHTNHLSGYS